MSETRKELKARLQAARQWQDFVALRQQLVNEGLHPVEAKREALARLEANGSQQPAPAIVQALSDPLPVEPVEPAANAESDCAMIFLTGDPNAALTAMRFVADHENAVPGESALVSAYREMLRTRPVRFAEELNRAELTYWESLPRAEVADLDGNADEALAVAKKWLEDHRRPSSPASTQ